MIPVAVVGAGPVGLLLALSLDRLGVPTVVLDGERTQPAQPRGSTHNARTMEHYRALGLAAQVRGLGLPWDHPTDIAFFTRYSGHELARLPRPSAGQVLRDRAAADRVDQTPEPMHRANQMYVERLLLDHARTRPNIGLRLGWRVVGLAERSDHVALTCECADVTRVLRAAHVVGCDGGRSFVRRVLGIGYAGPGSVDQDVLGREATAAHLRIPRLYRDCLAGRRAWSHWSVTAEFALNLIAVNGVDEFFLLTSSLRPGRVDDDAIAGLVRRAIGAPLPVRVLGHRRWTPGAALVAERFGEGRVLLAGDAAHLFTPNGGFGMNTGIDDVVNLAWKLAAAVQGWGGARLLDTYELERRPVALRNTRAARELNLGLGAVDRPADLEADTPGGRAARAKAGAELAEYGRRTLDTSGVQLGARYDGSPIVVADGGTPPADDFTRYTPTSVPGGRAPHLWLDDFHGPHSSLYDRFGAGFTLLRLGGRAPHANALRAEAAARGIPLTVLTLPDPVARDLYERDLVLVRPDQHVAWRGNREPEALWPVVTGH
ncbi:FAD-dependent monooxygenase [Saccharothrix obliqua]|uniref:FAD-dependent monooxygenase n=1 Tax=Saccharothrix obliqua TaxID=2861747 RepID=UPI001C5EF5DD|nr:FAD-dependent monooxygenase [Saccharothrix obliqua]MBW4717527.1 FAD-dependent monooxygenase [Saccharothrix obliqua]